MMSIPSSTTVMLYHPVPPLEHIAAINVTTILWNSTEIRDLVENFHRGKVIRTCRLPEEMRAEWIVIEDIIRKKVPLLLIPEVLKEKILTLVKPIGMEIFKWNQFHKVNCDNDIGMPNEFCWTPNGSINTKKTAEILVNDSRVDITIRYKLACFYCLENHIRELYKDSSPPLRHDIIEKGTIIMKFWRDVIEKVYPITVSGSFNSHHKFSLLFRSAVLTCNVASAKFFWQHLTLSQKRIYLRTAACFPGNAKFLAHSCLSVDYHNDLIFFFLSLMYEHQETNIFTEYACKVLPYFLDWPWQNLFMQMANHAFKKCPYSQYKFTLQALVHKICDGCVDYDYQQLFIEFWDQTPEDFKRCAMKDCMSNIELLEGLYTIDRKSIKLFIENATIEDQNEIVSCYKNRNYSLPSFFPLNFRDKERDDLLNFLKELVQVGERKRKSMEDDDSNPSKRSDCAK